MTIDTPARVDTTRGGSTGVRSLWEGSMHLSGLRFWVADVYHRVAFGQQLNSVFLDLTIDADREGGDRQSLLIESE